jgi:DNA-binding phage protein
MKKVLVVSLIVLVALGLFTGVASARSIQTQTGTLHDYMEQALADKLNLSLATVESEFDAGKTMAQIALDHGVTQANLYTFMLEVRTQALQAAVADGVITQAQADWMGQRGGRGMGFGMRAGGTGPCGGTGIPVGGSMMQRGGRWQQTNP